MKPAKLALEDGTVFSGQGFGASGERYGEVVFNTSMTGYQEILTDPSYKGQIVTMTYPLIGNYGVNEEDTESRGPQVEGFVVRELSRLHSNFRANTSLGDYLAEHGIVGLADIDTRALVRHIRVQGAMKGVLSTEDLDDGSLVEKAKQSPGLVGVDLAKVVTPEKAYAWDRGFESEFAVKQAVPEGRRYRLVALDFGMKRNIARWLVQSGCDLTVLPADTSAEEIRALAPEGIFLSNGPGDPAPLTYAIQTIRDLIGYKPMFGICLGHELLGLALGAKIFKLKFGHRGANHPVLNEATQRVEITTQNHGFGVAADSLPAELQATHINLNDQTLEGMRHRDLPVLSVQYHPEASAGPHDSQYLFEQFVDLMNEQS
jgi:carbamoyl-phosphate synthase small subunit